jgi:hypothetical protein
MHCSNKHPSDALLEQASNEKIAASARVLARHVGNYKTRHGNVLLSESMELLATAIVTDEMAATLAARLVALVAGVEGVGIAGEGTSIHNGLRSLNNALDGNGKHHRIPPRVQKRFLSNPAH